MLLFRFGVSFRSQSRNGHMAQHIACFMLRRSLWLAQASKFGVGASFRDPRFPVLKLYPMQ